MIDWFKVAETIKKSEIPNIGTSKAAKVPKQAVAEDELFTVNSVIDDSPKVRYFPTIARVKALRLFDELAMNPPVSFERWASLCVSKGLSHNTHKFRGTIAKDLVSMNKLEITNDDVVLNVENWSK